MGEYEQYPYAPQAQPCAEQAKPAPNGAPYYPNAMGLGEAPVDIPKLPNEAHYYIIFCWSFFFASCFPLIPAGLSFFLRDQSIKMAAMGNAALARDKASQAKKWLSITYAILVCGCVCFIIWCVLIGLAWFGTLGGHYSHYGY